MTIIPTPQKKGKKVQGEFYPLQEVELRALYENNLINNIAYVHLALRSENPFCDRPLEVIPKEFANKWNIPESSVYKAIAKLKELGVILIKSGKILVQWIKDQLSDSANNYQDEQEIIKSDNSFYEQANNCQTEQNRSLEVLETEAYESSQTIQSNSNDSYVSNTPTLKNNFSFKKEDNQNDIQEEILDNNESIDIDEIREAIAESINDENENKCSEADSTKELTQEFNYEKARKDKDFIDWLARDWVTRYNDMTLNKARSNVRSYFINDPEKTEIRWNEYQVELKERQSNNQLINQSGSVNVYSDQYGNKTKVNDFTGCHDRQEEVEVSDQAKNKFAKFGEKLFGNKLKTKRNKGKGFGGEKS